jgi:hypothetical protein
MTRNSYAFIFAAALLSTAPGSLAAETVLADSSADDTALSTLANDATQAGSAAGIVNQCRSDATPIHSAFTRTLDGAKLDDATRESLWQRYNAAESSTLIALAGERDADCSNTNSIIEDTIRRLRMPVS